MELLEQEEVADGDRARYLIIIICPESNLRQRMAERGFEILPHPLLHTAVRDCGK